METVGLIGLGVMGANLARNMERNGFRVVVYNRTAEKTDAFMAAYGEGAGFIPSRTIEEFVAALERPRVAVLMVQAGRAVKAVIDQLRPLLDQGDIIVDAGNSLYSDTERMSQGLSAAGLRFVGMGVSGGEEGALNGPSMMPGCDPDAWARLAPLLERISAQTDTGPCVTHVGPDGAGHYVKMVHNGIEYGDMQLICEAYDLLRHGVGLGPDDLADVFADWNRGELESFLIEITSRIASFPDDQGEDVPLLDRILDVAGEKGTGKWTTQAALDLGVPIPTITAAVDARLVSRLKTQRTEAASLYRKPNVTELLGRSFIDLVRQALYASKVCSYAQGFALIQAASREHGWEVDLSEMARIWKGGCIIRARFLDRIRTAFTEQPDLPNLLLSETFRAEIEERVGAWRRLVIAAVARGVAAPAMTASLAYFDAYTTERLPAYLLQAQRDYFGAHTYERIDRKGTFHTQWN